MENNNTDELANQKDMQNTNLNTGSYNANHPSGNSGGGDMFKAGSIIVIIGILVLGGIYFWSWYKNSAENVNPEAEVEELLSDGFEEISSFDSEESVLDEALSEVQDPVSERLGIQGSSDDLNDIEKDLEASDLGDINLDDLGF